MYLQPTNVVDKPAEDIKGDSNEVDLEVKSHRHHSEAQPQPLKNLLKGAAELYENAPKVMTVLLLSLKIFNSMSNKGITSTAIKNFLTRKIFQEFAVRQVHKAPGPEPMEPVKFRNKQLASSSDSKDTSSQTIVI